MSGHIYDASVSARAGTFHRELRGLGKSGVELKSQCQLCPQLTATKIQPRLLSESPKFTVSLLSMLKKSPSNPI